MLFLASSRSPIPDAWMKHEETLLSPVDYADESSQDLTGQEQLTFTGLLFGHERSGTSHKQKKFASPKLWLEIVVLVGPKVVNHQTPFWELP